MTAPPAHTESLCPVCLARIEATIWMQAGVALMEKHCPTHGRFQVPIWRGTPSYDSWQRPKIPQPPPVPLTTVKKGCPEDCGLCPDHRQRSCTVLMEVTQRCNLNCPVCYADAGDLKTAGSAAKNTRRVHGDPPLATISAWFQTARKAAPAANIQISGGEPSIREDLPAIIALGRRAGFDFIQLNTNGLRIAEDGAYLAALKKAGLASVFLQFDAMDDAVYKRLRGRKLLDIKLRAIEACAEANIGVVLTPTLVPGLNTDDIGAILEAAIAFSPSVRAVHFQPISYFGRYFTAGGEKMRLTLPELMTAIEAQSDGRFTAADFQPPGCENARCSFHGRFLVLPGGRVTPINGVQKGDCCGGAPPALSPLQRGRARPSPRFAVNGRPRPPGRPLSP